MRCLAFVAIFLCSVTSSFAGVYVESELTGTATNNSLATAEFIGGSLFTSPNPPTVFLGLGPTATVVGRGGGDDVDIYAFDALGGTIDVDMDNALFSFDTILSLFDSNGLLLAYDDDSFFDLGSQSALDSYLGTFTLPSAGRYYLAVTQFFNFPDTSSVISSTSLVAPNGGFGGESVVATVPGANFGSNGLGNNAAYTMHISLSQPAATVPEPSSLAIFGLIGAYPVVRRVRNRTSK